MQKNKSKRGKLVNKFHKDIKWEDYNLALDKKHRGWGIYVLYKDGEIYYIGKSEISLRRRIRRHALGDKHKGKWDSFAFFQIGKTRFIDAIESLLITICDPPGNSINGKDRKKWHDLSLMK